MTIKIKPRPDCRACLGTGEVSDSVPYGSTTVSMYSTCDFVLEQCPEGQEDDIEIDLSEYRSIETIRRAEGERVMREADESDRDQKRAADAFDDWNAGEGRVSNVFWEWNPRGWSEWI